MTTCTRCGMSTEDGLHETETECIDAVDREIRALRARTKELGDRRIDLVQRQLNRWKEEQRRRA